MDEKTEPSHWPGKLNYVFNSDILPVITYGAETLTLRNKKLAQRAMSIPLKPRIPNREIRRQTGVLDAKEMITTHKWNWAGHVVRMTDNRCTR